MTKLTVAAKDCKALLLAVTKFPITGGLAGTELISFTTSKGRLYASTFGLTLSRASVPCTGEMPPIAIDERHVAGFLKHCPDDANLTISVDTEIVLRCKKQETGSGLLPAAGHKMTPIKNMGPIITLEMTAEMAKRISYLSALAFSDSSRAELCCTMLTNKYALACSQKAVAILDHTMDDAQVALPLPIARVLTTGDICYVGKKETILKSGIGYYAMPSPIKAQSDFPVKALQAMKALVSEKVAECSGEAFATAVDSAGDCLSSISRTEVILVLQPGDGKLEIKSTNGGARYRTEIKAVTNGYTDEFKIPWNELSAACAFIGKKPVVLSVVKRTNEIMMNISGALFVFPSWSGK